MRTPDTPPVIIMSYCIGGVKYMERVLSDHPSTLTMVDDHPRAFSLRKLYPLVAWALDQLRESSPAAAARAARQRSACRRSWCRPPQTAPPHAAAPSPAEPHSQHYVKFSAITRQSTSTVFSVHAYEALKLCAIPAGLPALHQVSALSFAQL